MADSTGRRWRGSDRLAQKKVCLMASFDLSILTAWGWLWYASEWTIRIIMLVIIPFRRSPAAAKGWLLLIFFLPSVGLILFLLIGRNRWPEWRLQRLQESRAQMVRVGKRLRNSPNMIQPQFS